jgi:hypothetical protein
MSEEKIIDFIKNMKESEWVSLGQFTQEARQYIIFLIQTQTSGALETDGISYQEETHKKFRKLNIDYAKNTTVKPLQS